MKINVILITGNELRHKFFASYMSTFKNINLKFVIHEKNIKLKNNPLYRNDVIVNKHINERNKSERRFFKKFVQNNKKYKFNTLKNGEINTDEVINLIKTKKVNFIVSYGCSIIFVEVLNNIRLGGYKLGFWFAQQGSIYTFVILIFYYVYEIDKIDKRYGVADH